MDLIMPSSVTAKILQKHGVLPKEVHECFYNRIGNYLIDTREKNKTRPPTLWFVAETDRGRRLKICFVPAGAGNAFGLPVLKTAYPPDATEEALWRKHGL